MQLRVSHFPQIPCKPFIVSVATVAEGVKVMDMLADYDQFQYDTNIKGDYANAAVLEMFDPKDSHDNAQGSWVSWCDEDTGEDDPRAFIASLLGSEPTHDCADGQLPDGPVCPACGKERAPSGVDGGSWVHKLEPCADLVLSMDEYQSAALELAILRGGVFDKQVLIYRTLGLSGESGEFAEKVKKMIRDDNGQMTPPRLEAMLAELGDVLWYVATLAEVLGHKLSHVASLNINKLRDRKARGVRQGSGDNR